MSVPVSQVYFGRCFLGLLRECNPGRADPPPPSLEDLGVCWGSWSRGGDGLGVVVQPFKDKGSGRPNQPPFSCPSGCLVSAEAWDLCSSLSLSLDLAVCFQLVNANSRIKESI